MAAVRLSDVVIPQLWTTAFVLENPNTDAFFNSGVARNNPIVQQYAQSTASVMTVPAINHLDGSVAENVSSDDPAVKSSPNGIGTTKHNVVKVMRNQSWSEMNLVSAFFTPDPVAAIRNMIGKYWVERWQAYITAVCTGVIASNVANNAGDMVLDVTAQAGAAGKMSLQNVLTAKQTMGDHAYTLNTIVMHSTVFTNLQIAQQIAYIPQAQTNINLPFFGSYRVVVDDQVPVALDSPAVGDTTFTSYIYGTGFIQWGTGTPKVPTEIFSTPDAGNGEGQQTLYNRQHWIGHPYGFSYAGDSSNPAVDAGNPANATLASAASWTRKYDRKLIPFVALKTLG